MPLPPGPAPRAASGAFHTLTRRGSSLVAHPAPPSYVALSNREDAAPLGLRVGDPSGDRRSGSPLAQHRPSWVREPHTDHHHSLADGRFSLLQDHRVIRCPSPHAKASRQFRTPRGATGGRHALHSTGLDGPWPVGRAPVACGRFLQARIALQCCKPRGNETKKPRRSAGYWGAKRAPRLLLLILLAIEKGKLITQAEDGKPLLVFHH